MTNSLFTPGRLAGIAGLSAAMIVSATEFTRGQGVGTIAYVVYGTLPCEGCVEDYTGHPLGLALMRPDGSGHVQLTTDSADGEPAWSPDGLRLAFSRSGDLYVMSPAGGTPVNLTNDPSYDWSPAWSPDGGRIAFTSDRGGSPELYLMDVDGSNVSRLTDHIGYAGRPAWAPDGSVLAFNCSVETGNADICTITVDGSTLTRLTSDPARDSDPAWSPDGSTIAFASERYGTTVQTVYEEWLVADIALMNRDGSGVRPVNAGTAGEEPSWSPDGARIAFHAIESNVAYEWGASLRVGVMNVDGSGSIRLVEGFAAAWGPAGGNLPPIPSIGGACDARICSFNASSSIDPDGSIVTYAWDFGDGTTGSGPIVTHTYATANPYIVTLTVSDDSGASASLSQTLDPDPNFRPNAYGSVSCDASTCSFDGSSSWDYDGTIVSYLWEFGDGTSASGAIVSHTYGAPGIYLATLTVTDNEGATGSQVRGAVASSRPVASFTFMCSNLVCGLDGSASSDVDGTVVSYEWAFGDGTYGSGPIVNHTYEVPGTYNVLLIVRDNGGLSNERRTNVTVTAAPAHVGDLDRAATKQSSVWTATVTIEIHTGSHAALANAKVSGSWSNDTVASCVTGASGRCSVSLSGIARSNPSVSFSVTWVSHAVGYRSDLNHDADGDSGGTTIEVRRP
jgi:PKD repeat protein